MTPKEKAKELVDKFTVVGLQQRDEGVECALVCVDEMFKFAYDIEWEKREEAVSKLKFLKEVKKEINKL